MPTNSCEAVEAWSLAAKADHPSPVQHGALCGPAVVITASTDCTAIMDGYGVDLQASAF